MPLKPVTHDFLALVERETGYPVQLIEDPGLPTLAKVRKARGTVPAHFVSYRPTRDEGLDYMICYQCGFVLRLFETPGIPRMDAVMYCLDALQKFEKMTPDEVQKIGFEIAILGMSGLDVNDAEQKYRVKGLPGQFSGLHLVCLEYVAFKQFAPEKSIGFDLAREYEMARALHAGESDK